MHKMMMLAAIVAVIVASAAFAEENAVTLREGDAYLINPNGTFYKSNGMVSDAQHKAALAQGATEVSRATALYKHGGKVYAANCVGQYIGGWVQGHPGTENFC